MTKKEFEDTARATIENAMAEYGGVAGCFFVTASPKGQLNSFIGGSMDRIADALATVGLDEAQVATLLRASIRRMNKLKIDRMNDKIYPFKAK